MPADLPAPRVCLVTGAGRGIGAAIGGRLSQLGHRVALCARTADELDAVSAGLPGPSLVVPADLTVDGSVAGVFDTVEAAWGPVEILVVNAGAANSAPVARITDVEWQHMLDLNLTAPFRCIRRALPAMTAAGWGRVVVIASVAAKRGEPYIAAYTAAKHGVLGLVRAAAAEVARTGVTVNAVCPGYVDTPMTDGSVQTIIAMTGRTPEQARAALEAKQPIGRLVTVDEVADAVELCVVNAAMTGQGINVDGGAVQS
ncbi:MAG TPA: SDR family NAD(P)-dependent oxidoreductase [Jiangellaceae bacterium]|nr:SDR family NAD(P)-dependent oxidoreductase [Jiangellaceae bacterium]